MKTMRLVAPTKKYARSWHAAMRELGEEGMVHFWGLPYAPENLTEYIRIVRDHAQRKNLPRGWVPATTFWLIDHNEFIGAVNIRHHLTARLRRLGGHIGYAIRPSKRKKGYGTKILTFALKKAKAFGMRKVLVTCLDENIASQKIIEKNGGVLYDTLKGKEGLRRRYWIEL